MDKLLHYNVILCTPALYFCCCGLILVPTFFNLIFIIGITLNRREKIENILTKISS